MTSGTGLARLLAMQVPADLADWLDMVAIGALLAFAWQAPPVAFAWHAVAMAFPPVTLGLVLGVYVDRWPLRRTLVLANIGRGLATGALILVNDWPTLVAVVGLRAAADAAFDPAKQAALQAIVAPDRLVAANGLSQGINQAAKIVAPAIGAMLLLALDPQDVFAVNAVLSLLAALMALSLPALGRNRVVVVEGEDAPSGSLLAELASGLRLLLATPGLRAAALLLMGSTFAIFTYDNQIAPLLRELGQREETLGLFLAAIGAGGVIGSLGLMGLSRYLEPMGAVAAASALSAALVGGLGLGEVLGLVPGLLPLLGLGVALGLVSSFARVPLRAVIQVNTPLGMMGRVAALTQAMSTGMLLVAPFCGAALASASSVGAAFVLGAGLMAVVAGGAAALVVRHS